MPPAPTRFRRAWGAATLALLGLIAASPVGLADPSRSDRAEARAQVASLEDQLTRAIHRYEEARARVDEIVDRMATAERQIREIARRMLVREKEAIRVATALYKTGSAGVLEGMLGAADISDMTRRLKYLESSGVARSSVFEDLIADRAELEEKLDLLDGARAEAIDEAAELSELKDGIAARVAAERDRLATLNEELQQDAVRVVAEAPPRVFSDPPAPTSRADWEAIAMCESGGRWHLDSTYDGGLQFHPNTWLAYGGGKYARYAWQATKAEQIAIAEKVLAGQGPGAWPNCFKWK